MDPRASPSEIAGDLTRNQYKSLEALRRLGGEARTREITSSTAGIYGQLLHTHYSQMIGGGLVEKVEEADLRGESDIPTEGNLYRITDRGRDVLSAAQEDYNIDPLEEGQVRSRFEEIEDRLGSLETEISGAPNAGVEMSDEGRRLVGLRELAALEKEVGELRESHEALIEDCQKLFDTVQDMKEAMDDLREGKPEAD